MEITETRNGNALILRLIGRLDAVTSKMFEERLTAINEGEKHVIVDCSQMEYISSAGLRVFLVAGKKLKTLKGIFVLFGLSASVRVVFDQTGFSAFIPIYVDEVSALAHKG
ncbi:MAG: STAS domain-containing protein [Candidatus Ozemobacteraceae bacterium]